MCVYLYTYIHLRQDNSESKLYSRPAVGLTQIPEVLGIIPNATPTLTRRPFPPATNLHTPHHSLNTKAISTFSTRRRSCKRRDTCENSGPKKRPKASMRNRKHSGPTTKDQKPVHEAKTLVKTHAVLYVRADALGVQ